MNSSNFITENISFELLSSRLYIQDNLVAPWIFSYNNYIIGGLFLLLISWNIWITWKLFKLIKEITG